MSRIILCLVFLLGGLSARAAVEQDGEKILSFQEWKGSQVVEAKNQVARLSNRLTLLKKTENTSAEARTQVSQLESQLKTASEGLQFTTELTLKDYFAVYLSRLKDNPEAISAVAERLSKEEVHELLRVMLGASANTSLPTSGATQPRGASVEALSAKSL